MILSELIKIYAASIRDPGFLVTKPEDWQDIINFGGGELFPEIGFRGTITKTIASLGTVYQVDLSSYTSISGIKEVWVEDSDGKKSIFDNWVYNKELNFINLEPDSSKTATRTIAYYSNIYIVWFGFFPTYTKYSDTVELNPAEQVLLRNVCQREALSRILFDQTKLDRYRTLVGRTNEYSIMRMISNLEVTIEMKKRRLVDTHEVRTF